MKLWRAEPRGTSTNESELSYPQVFGTCHGDDLAYLFPVAPYGFPVPVVTEDQKKVQQNLVSLVTNFAISGVAEWNGVWQPVTVEQSL